MMCSRKKRIMLVALLATAVLSMAYLALCMAVYWAQDSLIFFPRKLSTEAVSQLSEKSNTESIELITKDGVALRGWLVKNNANRKSNLLIYFGGNAEEVSYLADKVRGLYGWSVALINYRGYGDSEGKPTEAAMYSDALEIYDHFAGREDIDSDHIAVMGRSLGTGVASYLAANRKVSTVILVSPYDSLASVAQENYPYLPVGLLMKYRFDTAGRAPSITAPLLLITASRDTTIPARHSEVVAEKWGGSVTRQVISGDHNSICLSEEYWKAVEEYLVGR